MAKLPMLGNRLRRLRKSHGLTQVDLARRLDISSSYLNLIEHNQRNLTAQLLLRISDVLNVPAQAFAPHDDGHHIAEVTEILRDSLFNELDLSVDDIRGFVDDAPALCQALVALYRSYQGNRKQFEAMNERLAHDPLLSANTHRLRTLLTSIVSFSEILRDNADLPEQERRSFLSIVSNESGQLGETVDAMLDSISGDGVMGSIGNVSPDEAVTDFLQAQNNYFDELESAAAELRRDAGLNDQQVFPRLVGYLKERHGVSIEIAPGTDHDSPASLYEKDRRLLLLSEALPPASLNFHLALLIGYLDHGGLLDQLTQSGELATEQARVKACAALANYFAGACLLPYDVFLKAATEVRYDIELLQQRFSASFEQICHRLTTLRRPGSSGIQLHLVRVDIAGNISKRFSASGLQIPRYGSACPRWVMHNAFLTPGVICTQVSQMPDGARFFSIAKTISKPGMGFNQPKSHYSISIGCELGQAHGMVYADSINLDPAGSSVAVGIACRLCDRVHCVQRAANPPTPHTTPTPAPWRNISPGIGELFHGRLGIAPPQ